MLIKSKFQLKSRFVFIGMLLSISLGSFGQNVAINSTGNAAAASAGLDIDFSNKGLLIPRVALTSTTDITTIASPTTSLLVYNTATAGVTPNNVVPSFYYFDGTKWVSLGSSSSSGNYWETLGNTGTVDGINFIGTTDNVPLNMRVNNQKAGKITSNGETSLGYHALNSSTGLYNTAIGFNALFSNTTGVYNTAIGYLALLSNTSGVCNTANGTDALYSNTTGYRNTANGLDALFWNTTGYQNTANGAFALLGNTTGINNTANGYAAQAHNTSGINNTANGYFASYNSNIGSNNTAIGYAALSENLSGSNNTAIGYYALSSNVTGSNNTAIGNNAQVPSGLANDQICIGNTAVSYAGVQVAWTVTSDRYWKEDIQPTNLGLEFITQLHPVSYIRKDVEIKNVTTKTIDSNGVEIEQLERIETTVTNSKDPESKKREYGFIAQELEQSLLNAGAADNGIISKDDEGHLGVRYNDLMAPMVKSIQELNAKNQELVKKVEDLEKELKTLLLKASEEKK